MLEVSRFICFYSVRGSFIINHSFFTSLSETEF